MFQRPFQACRAQALRRIPRQTRLMSAQVDASSVKMIEDHDNDSAIPLKSSRLVAYIRTDGPGVVRTPADALTIVREVERRFGVISEYIFPRDYEVQSAYQSRIRFAFRDEQSLKDVPQEGTTFQIKLPHWSGHPGGPGLDDFADAIQQESEQDVAAPQFDSIMEGALDEKATDAAQTISCTLLRSNTPLYSESFLSMSGPPRQLREAIAREFINWGGFYNLKSIDRTTVLPKNELFGKQQSVDHIRMREALRRSCHVANVPNPYEYDGRQATAKATSLPWEPLSEVRIPEENLKMESVSVEGSRDREMDDTNLINLLDDTPLASQSLNAGLTGGTTASLVESAAMLVENPAQPKTKLPKPPAWNEEERAAQLEAARDLARRAMQNGRKAAPKPPSEAQEMESEPRKSESSLYEQDDTPSDVELEAQRTEEQPTSTSSEEQPKKNKWTDIMGRWL